MTSKPAFSIAFTFASMAVLSSCDEPKQPRPKESIGSVITGLHVKVGGIWQEGFSIDVAPGEYAVFRGGNCPADNGKSETSGAVEKLCVMRITSIQSDKLEKAMEPFRKAAMPLSSFSVADYANRPDGAACRNRTTDGTQLSFIWDRTDGSEIAAFDFGCDEGEFGKYYRDARAVAEVFPKPTATGGY